MRELLPSDAGRIYPVGRLDIMSEGLLLMTNDGDFAMNCMHPSRGVLKTYRTSVSGSQVDSGIHRLREPFLLDGAEVQAVKLRVLKQNAEQAVLDITVREGKNREIRRMCEMAGLHVERLIRFSVGGLALGNLPTGKARELSAEEIASVFGDQRK